MVVQLQHKKFYSNWSLRRFFLLARDPEVRAEKLRKEFSRHKDVVQGNFDEAYTMLSYKHIMGLQWVNQQCKTNNQQRFDFLTIEQFFLKNGIYSASFSFIFVFSNKLYNSYNK